VRTLVAAKSAQFAHDAANFKLRVQEVKHPPGSPRHRRTSNAPHINRSRVPPSGRVAYRALGGASTAWCPPFSAKDPLKESVISYRRGAARAPSAARRVRRSSH
jgi:hypothetical protein